MKQRKTLGTIVSSLGAILSRRREPQILKRMFACLLLGVLCVTVSMAQSAEIGKNISLSYSDGSFNINCSNFNSSAQSVKIFIDFGEEAVNYATCAYDRWTPQNTAKSFFNLNNFTKRYYTIIVTNSAIISEMASGAGVSVDYGPVRTVNVIVTNYSTADGAANDKSEASGIAPNEDEDDPVVTMTLEDMIKEEMQLTNVPTIYLTVPDALNEDGTRKDINSVIFKDRQKNEALYHQATIRVVDEKGGIEPFTDQVLIKARGNSTADLHNGKLPYRLKFAKEITDEAGNVIARCQKHDMLGNGYTARNWTLLANQKDESMMRNALTYHVGQAVGMPFCPGYKFVDVVINGEYRGTYQISDHVEVGENRVKVNEDTGWFIESAPSQMCEEPKVYAGGLFMTIKNPEPKETVELTALKTEVEDYFKKINYYMGVWSTPCSDEEFRDPVNGWRKYFDEESLVKFYIGINLTGDYDGFMTVKMYREANDKMKFGPLWDKDLAYGNWGADDGVKLCEEQQVNSNLFSDYMQRIMTDPVFVKKVHDKLHSVLGDNNQLRTSLHNEIDNIKKVISKTYDLNKTEAWRMGQDLDTSSKTLKDYITLRVEKLAERIDKKYSDMGGDEIVIPEIPDTPTNPSDDTPTGDLGALVDLGNGKCSYTGSASTFKAGTEITITTSTAGTTLSNYIIEGTAWNTTKTITLTAADVTTLAANSYTFYMNATGGEVKAVNVKAPVASAGAEFNKEYTSSYETTSFNVPASNFNANATSIKVIIDWGNTDGAWTSVGFSNNAWDNDVRIDWTTSRTSEFTITDASDIAKVASSGITFNYGNDKRTVTITVINYGSNSGSSTTPTYTLTLNTSEGGTVSGAGTYAEGTTVLIKAIPNAGYKFVRWSDDNTYASRSVTLKEAITLTATFAAEGSTDEDPFNERGERKQLTNLPTIYLDATVGNEWSGATLEVFDADNKLGQGTAWTKTTTDVYVQFQGSGDKNKDSYRLKFETKTQLLSSGKFKQWVLLANDDDPTMMRNALAKEMGDALGLPFTPGYQFVDLYVNNNYMGTYQVTDRIKVESGRALVTGGNKDLDWHVRFNDATEYNEDKPTYYIAGTTSMPYIIPKNPDPKDDETTWNSTLKSGMTTYFNNVFTTDASGKYTAFADNVDHQQLIEWYIAQEMLCVYKGFSSIEAYRSVNATDKNLHIGVLWDSEKAFGNTGEAPAISMADLNTAGSYNGLMTNYAAYDVMKNIFTQLWQERWFANGVNNLWKEKHEAMLAALTSKATALKTELADSWAKNATKWNITGEQAASVETMTTWLTERDAYLTKKFAALAAAVPCETHTYENHNYIEQTNGTYLIGCDVCGTIKADSETYYKFTVYPESATKTEVIATSWHPSAEHPNSIAVVEAKRSIVEKIEGWNIVCGKKTTFADGSTGLTCKDFRLTDGHPYYSDNKFVATTATYSRSISNAWGTICLPYKMQNAKTEYASFYHLSSATDDALVFTPVQPEVEDNCSAYMPVAFRATAKALSEGRLVVNGENVTVKKSSADKVKQSIDGWTMYGTMEQTRVKERNVAHTDGTIYYLSGDKFYYVPLSSSYTSNPFRGYYVCSVPQSQAKTSIMIGVQDEDVSTSMTPTPAEGKFLIFADHNALTLTSPSDAVVTIYTAAGQQAARLALKAGSENTVSLASGLYVVNGTKVVVK